jgi:hypothetical protein
MLIKIFSSLREKAPVYPMRVPTMRLSPGAGVESGWEVTETAVEDLVKVRIKGTTDIIWMHKDCVGDSDAGSTPTPSPGPASSPAQS